MYDYEEIYDLYSLHSEEIYDTCLCHKGLRSTLGSCVEPYCHCAYALL